MADNGTYWWYSDSHAKLTHFFRCRTSLRADSYHTEVVDVQQNSVKTATMYAGDRTVSLKNLIGDTGAATTLWEISFSLIEF